MAGEERRSAELEAIARARLLAAKRAGEALTLPKFLKSYPDAQWDLATRVWLEVEGGLLPPDVLAESTASEAPDSGSRSFGPYLLQRELGRGGQGTVYLADDPRLKRRVALKVLKESGPGREMATLRLQREAEVASKLDHSGICTVFDTGVVGHARYIAMQYLEGETLAQRIVQSKTEDISRATEILTICRLIEETARALHAAHETGVLHRDMKPANIMVTPEGRPVIMDFGLAGDEDPDALTLTRSGDIFGTPAYMSPEQIKRQATQLDRRTDVYSTGVILFEHLCLQRPFDSPTREGLFQAILTQAPPDIRRLNREIPSDLKVIIETAIEKDRDHRYQTALDLAEDLRRFREHEPIRARPVSPLVKLLRWAQRNPLVAASLSLALVCLTVGLVVSLVLMAETARERDAKDKALSQYDQMSDSRKIRNLADREKELWPCHPDKVAAMDAWLRDASALRERLQLHEDTVRDLEARALPYSEEDRARDEATRKEADALRTARIARIQQAITQLENLMRREGLSTIQQQSIDRKLKEAQEAVETHESDPGRAGRLTWQFGNEGEAWRHEVLRLLVQEIPTLDPFIASVRARQEFAQQVRPRTMEGTEATRRWRACLADIRNRDGRHAGLDLEPQLGLLPLGRNADSGLWEFWHVGSGKKPGWEGEFLSGRVQPVRPETGLVLVLIPAGAFWMGAQSESESEWNFDPGGKVDESPVQRVALDAFFMSKFELTQGQWRRIMWEDPKVSTYYSGYMPLNTLVVVDDRHPAESVSREDFVTALGRYGLTLPTEAQWEYAARAGTEWPWWCGRSVKALHGCCNIGDETSRRLGGNWPYEPGLDDGHQLHAPVGSMRPNPYGLHDVIGNVKEWCLGNYGSYTIEARTGDGLRLTPDTRGVLRGGSFDQAAAECRSAYRFTLAPGSGASTTGCRPARRID